MGEGWKPDGQAFCWQPKAALHLIRERLDAEHSVASALAVYLALTEIASDNRSETFTTTHSYISMRCGLGVRTVQSRLKDLATIGLVGISTPKVKAPSTYRLLITDAQPLPNDKQPLPRVEQLLHDDAQPLPNVRQRTKQGSLPTYKEIHQECTKEKAKNPNEPVALILNGKLALELMERCKEVFGDDEMKLCHRRWLDRAEANPQALERLLSYTSDAGAENPAAYAESQWPEFNTKFHAT